MSARCHLSLVIRGKYRVIEIIKKERISESTRNQEKKQKAPNNGAVNENNPYSFSLNPHYCRPLWIGRTQRQGWQAPKWMDPLSDRDNNGYTIGTWNRSKRLLSVQGGSFRPWMNRMHRLPFALSFFGPASMAFAAGYGAVAMGIPGR